MSRLIVKNLPSYTDTKRLREHFERRDGPGGTITDVKVAMKPDGSASRGFGFVGFKTDAEAKVARDWFDRTYVGSTRINVALVDGARDAPAPRPNKRRRTDAPTQDPSSSTAPSSRQAKATPDDAPAHKSKKASDMDEFMKTMKPRTNKAPAWTNDEPLPAQAAAAVKSDQPESQPDAEAETPAAEEGGTGVSDLDWMRQRMSTVVDKAGKVFEQPDEESEVVADAGPPDVEPEVTEPVDPVKQTILDTSRLFVRNLAFSCSEDELRQQFETFGKISQVHLPLDPASKTPKGFAYITFVNPEDAVSAYTALDKRSFQGRLLHILPAVDRHPKAADEDGKARGVKAERGAQRKAAAGREFNWAMLYMNSDAVASSIADRLNVSKADILNPDETDGVNPAVKLALAETHVIAETKAYLEANGCDLGAFAAPGARRSDSALLVKNIPYGTGEPALRELFEPHGALRRVLVPPAGTMAIVEFVRADEAGHAFRAVAYRRLGNAVVYLEKAPAGLLPEGDFAPPVKADADAETEEQGKPPAQTEEAAPGATLFVKNLAFATTTEQLVAALRQLPGFAFARVQMKPDATGQKRLSMGYGFAGFRTVEDATRAQRAVQGMVLGGHALEAKFAGRGREDEERQAKKEKDGKATTTKMIVKNLPFEANKKDIRALFSAHGQLKSVRLPKRLDHRARGFAFLEFLTRQEAEAAYDALRHTHLLGRHLVLEWADEGEQDVDALRAKAGVGFGGGKEMPGRKRKLNMDADGDEPMEDED